MFHLLAAASRMLRRGKLTSGMVRRSQRPARAAPAVRTCVGCRGREFKSDLLRVVGRGDEVIPDPQARLHGRGAYLHLSQECFDQAQRRRAFARALRLPGPPVTGRLGEYLAQVVRGAPCRSARVSQPGQRQERHCRESRIRS